MVDEVTRLKDELSTALARIADLEAALGFGQDNLGVAFKLSGTMSNLLGCLLKTPNVTPDMIMVRLQIATDAKVAINRLRNSIKEFGLVREDGSSIIQSRRGLGYWIDPADKARVQDVTRQGIISDPPTPLAAVAA
jgi:hypothetical protein